MLERVLSGWTIAKVGFLADTNGYVNHVDSVSPESCQQAFSRGSSWGADMNSLEEAGPTGNVSSGSFKGPAMALERELAVYNEHLIDLLANEGKYILIRNEEISGPFETYDDALEAGYAKYGLVPFLVKQILRVEPIYYFSRDLPPCRS
jgi:hypothetical protein